LRHDEVLETTERVADSFQALILGGIRAFGSLLD
jgi:hypothetical protein